MARQPNPNRKFSPSMLSKTTKARLNRHRKVLGELRAGQKTRKGNESDDQLINRILDHYEITNKPADVGVSTYNIKPVAPEPAQTTQ